MIPFAHSVCDKLYQHFLNARQGEGNTLLKGFYQNLCQIEGTFAV